MQIDEAVVGAFRALLSGNSAEQTRLLERLDKETASIAYPTLVGAAFFKAVFRRFANGTRADVVTFVSSVRERSTDAAEGLDPALAERMVLAALGHGQLDDVDGDTQLGVQIILLAGLVADAGLTGTDLEAFIVDATSLANEWMAAG